ncbi:hypothetical protein EV44_g0341 [Erysiphe necator]|uniref:Uncharacterized protein n=1 Tax=Uncinula necator TaxID=52586 RepID=A0A0B1PAP9_UNCNE|nr:hypothetical protein EV44_g0341 [Erysiphe necator]
MISKTNKILIASALFCFSNAIPLQEREVPQEHSHEFLLDSVRNSLKLDNPSNFKDPVFPLLGDKAAAQGAGNVTNLKCLQRKVADQAFTNEKKAGNTEGMGNALIYAALERNTGAVGKASEACDEPAVNPEINALRQHQDPASPGAKEANKELVLTLAKQLSSIGVDPQRAAMSATFAPGQIGDPTAKGNSCDDQDDKMGCIFTKKLIQVEATPEEIDAAVKSSTSSSSSKISSESSDDSKSDTTSSNIKTKNAAKRDLKKRDQFLKNNKFTNILQKRNGKSNLVPRHDTSPTNILKRDLQTSKSSLNNLRNEKRSIDNSLEKRRVVMTPDIQKQVHSVKSTFSSDFEVGHLNKGEIDINNKINKVKRDDDDNGQGRGGPR